MQPEALPGAVRSAIARCPFLHNVAASHGEGYAAQVACCPTKTANPHAPGLTVEQAAGFEASVRSMHGPGGAVPLKRFCEAPAAARCPVQHAAAQPSCPASVMSLPAPQGPRPAAPHPFKGVPVASMGLSAFGFLPDPGEFFRGGKRSHRHQQPQHQQTGGGKGPGQRGGPGGGGSGGHKGPQPPSSNAQAATGAKGVSGGGAAGGSAAGGGAGGGMKAAAAGAGAGGTTGGQCPMRKFFGPLGGLLPLSAAGHLQCPSAIIKMRAAVAALKPVRDLRPQALPIKALVMGATAVVANVPCGMWREHTRKFSPEWFLAVHATIPFVAMLRKAVLMPKWAILLTIIGAVAGQQAGARLERKRLAASRSACSGPSTRGARGALSLALPAAGGCREEAAPALQRRAWQPASTSVVAT